MPHVSCRFSLCGPLSRRLPGFFLLAIALGSAVSAEPATGAVSNETTVAPVAAPVPMMIANPLKRPPVKEVHITYHQKKFYFCGVSTNARFASADAC